jgi:protein SCO1/2
MLLLGFVLQLPVLSQIGIDPRIGQAIDPAISIVDEAGSPKALGDLFGSRPLLLAPVYYECPMLCSLQLNALVRALKVMPLRPGSDFDLIAFSIDPAEAPHVAKGRKAHYARDYGLPGAEEGFHFLTADAASIDRLASNIGFRFRKDAQTGQIAHATTLLVLTPDGRISQYLYGIEYDPGDIAASLQVARDGGKGPLLRQILLLCYQYDPATGRYSLSILRAVRLGGVATIAGIVIVAVWSSRRRRQV